MRDMLIQLSKYGPKYNPEAPRDSTKFFKKISYEIVRHQTDSDKEIPENEDEFELARI